MKLSILVNLKFIENLDFSQNCHKFLILVEILKIFDFGEKWQNYRIWSKL